MPSVFRGGLSIAQAFLSDILLLRGFTETTATEVSFRHLQVAAEKLGKRNIRSTKERNPCLGPRNRSVMSTQGLGINKSSFKAF